MTYEAFLSRKVCQAPEHGFTLPAADLNPNLLPHQAAIVPWLIRGGRRALFASFGLGKTVMQLEAVRIASESEGGRGLITLPLGVRQEFRRDAVDLLGWPIAGTCRAKLRWLAPISTQPVMPGRGMYERLEQRTARGTDSAF